MTDLAFPEIDEKAAQPVATIEPKQATLKETALASFTPIVAHMSALAQRYRDVAFDLLTPKGMAAAKAARLELRENGRYAVQRLQKRLKEEANDLKRTIDAKAEEAIAIVKPVEDAIHEQIEAREAQMAAEKAERERVEAERKAKHEAGIAKIRAYLTHCEQPGMTSARIKAGMDMLRAATFGPEWEEYAVPAASAQCETLEAMQRLHDAALAREQEAARLEAQRIENERIAAEQRAQAEALAAQQRALAEQAAELARQQAEIEAARLRAITPAAPEATAAATEGKADNPEPGTLEAAPIQRSEMAVLQSAGQHSQESACSTQAGRQRDDAHGGAETRGASPAEDCEDLPGVAPGPLHPIDLGEPIPVADTQVIHPADAGHAADIACIDWTAAAFGGAATPYAGPVQMVDHGIDEADLYRQCLAFVRLALSPRAGRFPSHPKPEPSHWSALYAAGDALLPRLAKVTGESV